MLADDETMEAMCLTEQRNFMAASLGDGGDVWAAGQSQAPPQRAGGGGGASTRPGASLAAMRQVERILQSYER